MPYNDIRVERIDGALLLQDKLSGSVGENVSVGYAFLATLFDRAEEHHLPFVVDSPVGSIDLDIRPRIGELLPKLAGQVIAFIIGGGTRQVRSQPGGGERRRRPVPDAVQKRHKPSGGTRGRGPGDRGNRERLLRAWEGVFRRLP